MRLNTRGFFVPRRYTCRHYVGIGGPVGSGKTALTLNLCAAMRDHYDMAVVTNDIYTREDAQFLTRHGALDEARIWCGDRLLSPHRDS